MSKRYPLPLLILLTGIIVGSCTKNAVHTPPETTPAVAASAAPVPEKIIVAPVPTDRVVTVTKEQPVTCKFVSPPLPTPLPVAPNVAPGVKVSDKTRVALMQAYIIQLTSHIRTMQQTEQQMYQNFVQACIQNPKDQGSSGKP